MPLSKKDLQRALSIFESLITQAESALDSDQGGQRGSRDELLDNLSTLQSTVDVLSSPLFSSLLDIKQQFKQRAQAQESPANNTPAHIGLKLDDDSSLLSQFRQTYGLTDDEVHVNQSAVSSLAEETQDDTSLDIASPTLPLTPVGQFPSTFVGDRNSEKEVNSIKTKHYQHTQKNSSSKGKRVKLFSRRSTTSRTGNVSLADLASSAPSISSKELWDTVQSASLRGSFSDSCESSLSSFSSDATHPSLHESIPLPVAKAECQSNTQSPLKHSLVEEALMSDCSDKELTITTSKQREDVNSNAQILGAPNGISTLEQRTGAAVCEANSKRQGTQELGTAEEGMAKEEVDGPKDSLYFMRDQQSQTELREIVKSKEPRFVTIELADGGKGVGLGIDFAGVSSTGVFVSKLYSGGVAQNSGKIQEGDQLLKLNEYNTDNIASFEVEMLVGQIPPGGQVTFMLKYNPIGWIECQRCFSSELYPT